MSNSGAYKAFLFDMDGTLLNSAASAERVWGDWARRHGLDVPAFLRTMHGRRAEDTLRDSGVAGLDIAAEARAITDAETSDTDGIVEIPGAAAFVATLSAAHWAIVTSAPLALAQARLKAAGLPLAPLMITAEDITRGKPDPQGYLLAAARLGISPGECLVFEDAVPGVRSGEAAGADVIVIGGHAYPPHAAARDYTRLSVTIADGRLDLHGVQ
jgi:sugar-phosphatase